MTRRSCLGHGKLPSNTDNGRWRREPRRGAVRHPLSRLFVFTDAVVTVFRKRPQEWDWIHRKRIPCPSSFFCLCFKPFWNHRDVSGSRCRLSLFFMLKFYCCVELSKRSLIRLAVSHSLEISYAVWACLCCSVIFGTADCFHLHVRVCETS